MNVSLSTDVCEPSVVPYFLWDDPMTVAEFRQRLEVGPREERLRLLGKLLREARDTDVWQFTTPAEVWREWPEIARYLGRRRGFWEFLFAHWQEDIPQVVADKPVINGVRIDPPQEILSNKLCALLSRAEIRDLVDVRALELAGFRVEDALPAATAKDRGLTPAQLAWVLGQIEIGDNFNPPGEISGRELRLYLNDLIIRLTKLSYPT